MDAAQDSEADNSDDDEVVQQIKHLLDTRVRPAVAMDGGDITFHSFDEGVVTLQMRGACQGCPSSTATLKMGIENMLRHYIPEVVEVRPTEE
jgi:Fe-S cluster biogenesis protein NfuA